VSRSAVRTLALPDRARLVAPCVRLLCALACRQSLATLSIAMLLVATPALGQRSVTVIGPIENPLRDGIPAFTLVAEGFVPSDFPLRFTLQVGTSIGFATGILADTTVAAAGTRATIAPRRVLPEKSSVYWRGVVTTAAGLQVNSAVTGPRLTAPWLTLLSPNNPNGSTVTSKRPTFTWSSAWLDPSAGRWQYEIRVISARGETVVVGTTDETSYVPTRDLEGNTSYHWLLSAWTLAGDSTRVQSAASFVVLDPSVPPATLLYQNFPNPFPNARVDATCVWFDLHTASTVRLQVLDLRGNDVRSLIPGAAFPAAATFPAGRYGRAVEGSDFGCDPRFSWDGRDNTGRLVPPGVYLIRLRTREVETFRKALFKGR
jgi:hypothetical protein